MGKSYKKTPIVKDGGRHESKKALKKAANRKIRSKLRQGIEIGGGNEYKKHTESWDIADYVCRWTKEEAIEQYNKSISPIYNSQGAIDDFLEHFPTLDSYLQYWERCMRRK